MVRVRSSFLISFLIFIFFFPCLFAHQENFRGRVSRIHKRLKLVRVFSEFPNLKFLKKGDEVFFWYPEEKKKICRSRVFAKGVSHVLLKVPYLQDCLYQLTFTVGSTLSFQSKQFERTLKMVKEVKKILLKKRLALFGQLERTKKELSQYMKKVEVLERDHNLHRQSLERKFKKKMSRLQTFHNNQLKVYKNLIKNMEDIDHKLYLYEVHPNRASKDAWSL